MPSPRRPRPPTSRCRSSARIEPRTVGSGAVDGLFEVRPSGDGQVSPGGDPAVTGGFTDVAADSPLAVRMRPASLDELVGQQHLLAPGAPLRQLVGGASPMSVILWGPPGSGKTTIAHLVAGATDRRFVAL